MNGIKEESVHCVVMRGGTTRGFFFHAKDLPNEPKERDDVLLAVVRGHDLQQVDGIGGADLLLNKVAVVWPSARFDSDIECLFGSITPGSARIKYGANCGNLISAVAVFALQEGLFDGANRTVRIFNPDSNTRVEAQLLDQGWWRERSGRMRSVGMPVTGVLVQLAFVEPAGTIRRGLLPTGRAIDQLRREDGKTVEASIVDSGALYVFVAAEELGLDFATTSLNVQNQTDFMQAIENLRGQAAVLVGLAATPAEARSISPAVPKVALVSAPRDYWAERRNLLIKASGVDILARIISSQSLHNAYAVTGAIATISAAVVPKSVVNRLVGETGSTTPLSLRIGHPSGIIEPRIDWRRCASSVVVERAYVTRTARTIMRGVSYLPEVPNQRCFAQPADSGRAFVGAEPSV